MNLENIAVLIVTAVIAVLLGVALFSSGDKSSASGTTGKAGGLSREIKTPTGSLDDVRKNVGKRGGRIDFSKARKGGYRTVPRKKTVVETAKAAPKAQPIQPRYKIVTVRPGDILGAIAKRELGSASRYDRIVAANPGLNPRKLRPGQKIRIPLRHVQKKAGGDSTGLGTTLVSKVDPGSRRTHQVRNGETLSGISKRYFSTTTRWRELFEVNRGLIRRPDRLKAGTVLVIPQ